MAEEKPAEGEKEEEKSDLEVAMEKAGSAIKSATDTAASIYKDNKEAIDKAAQLIQFAMMEKEKQMEYIKQLLLSVGQEMATAVFNAISIPPSMPEIKSAIQKAMIEPLMQKMSSLPPKKTTPPPEEKPKK